jgi:hypothetical protein
MTQQKPFVIDVTYLTSEMLGKHILSNLETSKALIIPIDYEWQDAPDKAGNWWVSAFCEGRYISPRILEVIDYQRPERRLEVRNPGTFDTIPVRKFVGEYYPNARWQYIPEPNMRELKTNV